MITGIDIIGLPHFSKHDIISERVLKLIDEFEIKPTEKYYKLGISTVSSVEKFVAEQMLILIEFYQNNYTDFKACDEETNIILKKIISQSQSFNTSLIIKIKIEFYANNGITNNIANKGTLTIFLIDNMPYCKLSYNTQLTDNVYKLNYLDLTDYSVFKYLSTKIKILPITSIVDNNSIAINDSEFIKTAISRRSELFTILQEYDGIEIVNDTIQYKNDTIKKIALKSIVNSRQSNNLFINAFVVKESSSIYYDNLLKEYDKEFTLIFIIAVCLLYYDKNDLIVLTHSFRNQSSFDYDIISRLYQFMLSDYIISNKNIFPQISLINS